MRRTLYLKRIDLAIQIILLLVIICFIVFGPHSYEAEYADHFYMAFYVLGGYQLVSCLLNKLLLDAQMKISGRWLYEAFLLIVVIITAMLFIGLEFITSTWSAGILLLFMFSFVNALMALWYLLITTIELRKIRKHAKS